MAKKGILGMFKGKEEDQELEKAEARIEELEEELRQKAEREEREKTKAELRAKRDREVEAAKAKREAARAKLEAEKAKEEAEKQVRKHIVESGDTLTAIALKYYGNAGEFMKIYEANKEVIGDNPDRILVGMELVIPEL